MPITFLKIIKPPDDRRVLRNPIACQIYVNLLARIGEDRNVEFSQRQLSAICGIPYQRFRTALGLLIDTGYITMEVSEKRQTSVGFNIPKNNLSKKKTPKTTFKPPEVDEVLGYCNKKGYHFDPEVFVSFYSSKGWMIGENHMKSWKSACVTWEKRWKLKYGNKFYYQIGSQSSRYNTGGDSNFTGIAAAILQRTNPGKGK